MEEELKNQVVDLFDDLMIAAPHCPEFVVCRMFFQDEIQPSVLMKRFVEYIWPYRDQIIKEDEAFFLQNDSIMQLIPGNSQHYVGFVRDLWTSGQFTPDDKEAIWDHLEAMIDTCREFQRT